MRYGGIEAGGTKWVCAIADDPRRPLQTCTFPTTEPAETVSRATRFFTENGPVDVLGVGAFGPVDIRRGSPTWGTITTTPKPSWADTDLVSALRSGLGVPIVLDTDVNAAAVGEWRAGGARQPARRPQVRRRRAGLRAGHLGVRELTERDGFARSVVPPRLGDQAGVVGALELARVAGHAGHERASVDEIEAGRVPGGQT